jgi:hypothetical protein
LSSILKALKKIEESTAMGETPAEFPRLAQQASFKARLRRQWESARRWGYGLLVVAMAAAGALIYISLKSDEAPAGKPDAAVAPPGKEFRAKIPAEGQRPAPPRRPAQAPAEPSSEPAGPAQRTIEMHADSAPPPPPPRPRAPAATDRTAPTVAPKESPAAAPSPASRPFAARREPAPAATAPKPARPPAPRSPEDGLARLDESKLRVMAIAWAEDPARRIAVVNGHILKEGESVDGYSITQIRKEDIVVNDGGRSWRVEFNLKTQP